MKWVLAIGILAVAMTVAVLGMGIVGFGIPHYCTPPVTHGFTPMICRIPMPPKPMPIPHANYH